ncbi:hypothetical protein K431DRAFT_3972 [Polychaeton citri CBS 116435]|uniref:NmrA-like domain-containing protein n=1 Tax=Polychaeton citri CBS 116435 TaxID=1314669 RepID=A0A9P4QJU6_9PEZI|nr:hypothetical protein K431DRAFT_3972 [Polychaeton citri CBS 116435]
MRRLLSQRSRSGIKPQQHRRSDAADLQRDSQTVRFEPEAIPPVPSLPRKNVGVFVASTEHPGMRLATALLNDGSYNVTFIVPEPFDIPAPPAARLVKIRADLPRIQLTHAVVGQQTLIAAPGFANRENEQRVIDAAHAAGVKEILVVECGIESSRVSHKCESVQVRSMRTAVKHFQSPGFPGLNWGIVAFGLPSVLDPKVPIEIYSTRHCGCSSSTRISPRHLRILPPHPPQSGQL